MKLINKEIVFKGFLTIVKLFLEADGEVFERLVLERKNAVAGIVYDKSKNKFIFTKQWRLGSEKDIYEVVAGVNDYDSDESECLKREVLEEIGYSIDNIQHINTCYLSPGGSTEKVSIYYCEGSKVSPGGGLREEGEKIEVIEFSFDEIMNTSFEDAKTIIAVDYIKNKFNKTNV